MLIRRWHKVLALLGSLAAVMSQFHPHKTVLFPTTSVVTGSSTVVFGHGVRHLVGTALSQAPVEAAIAGSASEVAATGVTSGTFNVIVNGITIEYRMAIIDGIIRIGTYFPL